MGTIQLKPVQGRPGTKQGNSLQVEQLIAKHPTLGQLSAVLRPHSGLSTELLQSRQGCQQLYERFGIRLLPGTAASGRLEYTPHLRGQVQGVPHL